MLSVGSTVCGDGRFWTRCMLGVGSTIEVCVPSGSP